MVIVLELPECVLKTDIITKSLSGVHLFCLTFEMGDAFVTDLKCLLLSQLTPSDGTGWFICAIQVQHALCNPDSQDLQSALLNLFHTCMKTDFEFFLMK